MSYFEFPDTRTYDNDLGWLIRRVLKLSETMENFINFNTIKYANPIAWNITTQYESNTVVINPADGTAYISTKPVPSGVLVTNTDYWTPIFNYGESMDKLREQIAAANEDENVTATSARSTGELVWRSGSLYIMTADIPAGSAYITGVNCDPITVEDYIKSLDDALKEEILEAVLNSTIYANVKDFGAKGDGVTDDSDAFQQAIDSAKPVFVPGGTYAVKNVTQNGGSVRILGGESAKLIPVYVDGIAQNIFYFRNCNSVTFKHIIFGGEKHGITNYDVMRQSAVDVEYANALSFTGCEFITIDDSVTDIERPFRKRKGLAVTSHDVNNTSFTGCRFSDMGNEECVWITNYNKAMDQIDVRISNCSSDNMFGLSLFDVMGNNIIIERFSSHSTDDFKTYSFSNLTCYNVKVIDSYFYGAYGDIIDMSEENLFFGDSIEVSRCEFFGYKSRAIHPLAGLISVKDCIDGGACLVFVRNAVASSQQLIEYFGSGCYTTYKPIKKLIISGCAHDSSESNPARHTAFMLNTLYVGGDVVVENCYVNQNGHTGCAVFSDGIKNLIVKNNTFLNAGTLTGASSYKAFVEASTNTENVSIIGNRIDTEGLCGIITASVKKFIFKDNIVDNLTVPLARNFLDTYTVEYLESDSTLINVYAKNYGRNTNASIYNVAWTAEQNSANDTPLTDDLDLPIGLYLLTVVLPYASTNVLYTLYDRTLNRVIAQSFSNGYGTITAPYRCSRQTKIYVVSSSSTTATFTNISQAGLSAVFLKE